MKLIKANPIQNPDAAEQKMAALWEQTGGRRFCLLLVGRAGEDVRLGVLATSPGTEDQVADMISSLCRNEDGDAEITESDLPETFEAASEIAIYNMLWANRDMPLEGKEWGWQRFDPLSIVYSVMQDLPEGTIAVIGAALQKLPNLTFRANLFAMACSSGVSGENLADKLAWKLVGAYGGIGVKPRKPILQRRAMRRAMALKFRFPLSFLPSWVVSRFWHPPLQDKSSGIRI